MKLARIMDVFITGYWGNENPSKETPNAVYRVRGADIMPLSVGEFGKFPCDMSATNLLKKRLYKPEI